MRRFSFVPAGLANGGRFSHGLRLGYFWRRSATDPSVSFIPNFDWEKGLAMSGGGGQYCFT
jgi:hypothetical protein